MIIEIDGLASIKRGEMAWLAFYFKCLGYVAAASSIMPLKKKDMFRRSLLQ